MSLMIRGMKFPISCSSCWFSQTEYKGLNEYCKAMKNEEVTKYMNQNKGRHPQCPLVEIPENHGRLIDADRLLAVLKSMASTNQSVPTEAVLDLIDHQPVIIEEERIK